jgi:IS605 OrfB family transposase
MQTITAKIQIYPNDKQIESLNVTRRAYQKAMNWLSERVFETRELKQAKLQELYYQKIRADFDLKSQMACTLVRLVIAKYKSAKSNGHDWSLVKFRNFEYDMSWNRDYSINKSIFSINTLDGRIKVEYNPNGMQKYFDGSWSFGTAKVVNKYGKWFLHIPMSKEIDLLNDSDINNIVGIDLGINFLATTYDSSGDTKFFSGKQVKYKRAKFSKARKEMQVKQTASARSKLKQIGSRENRWMSDINHQITKALCEQYPVGTLFVLEDLTGVRNATEKVKVKNRYVSVSWAFYQFRFLLEYKAKLYGHKVVALDPKYTSQTCPKCGHVNKANRDKKNHRFCCTNCSYKSNDDRIGAMNLHRKGIEYISAVLLEHDSVSKGEVSRP